MAIEHAEMMEEVPAESEASETAELPISILGGKKVAEGDVVRLKVVGVDAENGAITVEYATEPKMGGTAMMVKEFDKPD